MHVLYTLNRATLRKISHLAGMKSAAAFTPDGAAVWRALKQAADAADAHLASREAKEIAEAFATKEPIREPLTDITGCDY